jgi:hypothetical protein
LGDLPAVLPFSVPFSAIPTRCGAISFRPRRTAQKTNKQYKYVEYELRPVSFSIASERLSAVERHRRGAVDQRLSAERQCVFRSALRQVEDTRLRSRPRGAKDREQLQDDPRSFVRTWRLFRNI